MTGMGKKYLVAAWTAVLMMLSAAALATAATGLDNVRFEGYRRTRPDHLKAITEKCLDLQGAPTLTAVERPALEQCLTNSKLFSDVSVTVDQELLVSVKERWTLIPFPYFRSQKDTTNYGFFAFESNFLGRGQLLGVGATFGSLGNTYMFFLRDPSVAHTDWTSMLFYRQERGDMYRYRKENKADGYYLREQTFSVVPGFQFSRYLEGRFYLSYTDRSFEEVEPFESFPANYDFWSAGLGLKLDTTNFKFYSNEGHEVNLQVMQELLRSGDGEPALRFGLSWEWHQPFIGRNVAKLRVDGMAVDSEEREDSFQFGGQHGLRGVQEKGIWAQYLGGAVLDYQIPFWSGRYGTVAAGPFLSGAVYLPAGEGVDEEWLSTFSYGLGIFFYLREVAFPGIGITIGRNEEFSGNYISIQIGFTQ
jgi:outer membrane protein assembly factor BamA